MLIISVTFNQRRKFVLKPFLFLLQIWMKMYERSERIICTLSKTHHQHQKIEQVFFFFWSGILATADHRVSSCDCSEERFNLKSYYIYLVCSVYCVWFSVWLGSKILGPQRTGRGWISEEWSYSRDVKIFLEDCVSNLRLLSSSLFDGLTPQMNALSPIQ